MKSNYYLSEFYVPRDDRNQLWNWTQFCWNKYSRILHKSRMLITTLARITKQSIDRFLVVVIDGAQTSRRNYGRDGHLLPDPGRRRSWGRSSPASIETAPPSASGRGKACRFSWWSSSIEGLPRIPTAASVCWVWRLPISPHACLPSLVRDSRRRPTRSRAAGNSRILLHCAGMRRRSRRRLPWWGSRVLWRVQA